MSLWGQFLVIILKCRDSIIDKLTLLCIHYYYVPSILETNYILLVGGQRVLYKSVRYRRFVVPFKSSISLSSV